MNVTVHGAVYETVTLTDDKNEQIICETGSDGNGTASVRVGGTYTLLGSVSGYERNNVVIEENTTDIYDIPDGYTVLYWYGVKGAAISQPPYPVYYRYQNNNRKRLVGELKEYTNYLNMIANNSSSTEYATDKFAIAVTEQSFDVTNMKELRFKYETTSSIVTDHDKALYGIWPTRDELYVGVINGWEKSGTHTLDIESVTGNYYIGLHIAPHTFNQSVKVFEILYK